MTKKQKSTKKVTPNPKTKNTKAEPKKKVKTKTKTKAITKPKKSTNKIKTEFEFDCVLNFHDKKLSSPATCHECDFGGAFTAQIPEAEADIINFCPLWKFIHSQWNQPYGYLRCPKNGSAHRNLSACWNYCTKNKRKTCSVPVSHRQGTQAVIPDRRTLCDAIENSIAKKATALKSELKESGVFTDEFKARLNTAAQRRAERSSSGEWD